MRILAIRGCNLASLAGEFEIDLAHGALAGAGVFAIVGPTGAGKSTLLDAVCVALFDRTPRLTNRSTVVVGREDDPAALGAQDVRTLLRRGASTGWAEVDFESGDERRYRARWSVRRARGASDGRFQNQQVTLTAIDGGEQLGGTKTETLEAIHHRLGLSFDQFRRSALLAQGEFAAFLRADGKDRSELLERMTGTEIYSQLSVAAHVRAALAEQQLRERHGAALAIAVLSDDERARAEHELALAKQAQDATRSRLAAAESFARWQADAERKQREFAAAEAARIAAEQVAAAATAQRAELALRRRAETLRPRWDEVTRVERQLALGHAELTAANDAVARADAAEHEVAANRALLGELHAPIREARIASGLVERSAPIREPSAPNLTSLVERRRGAPNGDLAARARAISEDAAWLLARRALAEPMASWRELDGKLAEQAALASEIALADRALDDHARRKKQLAAQRATTAGEHHQATTRLGEAQREAAGYQQRRGLSLDAARRHEDEARQRCAELERLVALAAQARAAATARDELDRQLAELVDLERNDGERRVATERERDAAVALRTERARVVDELRKAAGYEHARAELVAGEPCPLCGATEHPWRDRGSFDALIADAQVRLAEAAEQGDAALATLATLAARDHHRVGERRRYLAARATASASVTGAQQTWRDRLATLGELLLVDDPASDAAERLAGERVEAARSKLEAARTARSHAEAVAKASAEAQAKVQARQTDVEHHAHKLRELDEALAKLEAAVERVRGERARTLARVRDLLAKIAGELARWMHESPTLTDARTLIQQEPHVLAADALAPCRKVIVELARAWTTRADVVADLDAELAQARAAIEEQARDAERATTEQRAHRDNAHARSLALAAELAAAAQQLDDARLAAGFEREQLRELLAAEPAGVERLAEHLDQLDRAVDRARTLVAERRRLVEEHAALRPALPEPYGVEAALPEHPAALRPPVPGLDIEALAAAVAAADHHAAAFAATLAADTDARIRRTAALAELAAAEHGALVDRVLGQVIGSHDGKLFRSFAQSLTLDGLLAVANSHLEELAPRYQLERVPKHDLELQVIDRDLGNEVRSVQSLSGGESFLVSLALALGLSSMSAHDVRVRTLLIDEGFGTLDPATLDSALAVLDALQATGRQVGIISHVPALVERVGAHVRVSPKGGGRSEVVVAE